MLKEIIKYKVVWISGLTLSLLMGLFGVYSYQTCTQNVGCLLYLIIPLLPGVLLNLEGAASIITSLIFWFLLGSLIGFLVYKNKKK